MRTHKRWLTVGMVLLALLLVSAVGVSAEEPPTRAVITGCPASPIIVAGSYYELGANIAHNAAGPCIVVDADNVTIDGKGFIITTSGAATVATIRVNSNWPTLLWDNTKLLNLNIDAQVAGLPAVLAQGTRNLLIEGGSFDGNATSGDLIEVRDSITPTIKGITVVDSGADGIHVYDTNLADPIVVTNVKIQGTTVRDSVADGIHVSDSTGVTIGGPNPGDGNTVTGSGGNNIWVDPSNGVTIQSNLVVGAATQGIRVVGVAGDNPFLSTNDPSDDNIDIVRNIVWCNKNQGISVVDADLVNVEGNLVGYNSFPGTCPPPPVEGSVEEGLAYVKSLGMDKRAAVVETTDGSPGIEGEETITPTDTLADKAGELGDRQARFFGPPYWTQYVGNLLVFNGGDGLHVHNGVLVGILRNFAYWNGSDGLNVDPSFLVDVIGNDASENDGDGLDIANSGWFYIGGPTDREENLFRRNDGHGIYINDSDYLYLLNNESSANASDGLHLDGPSTNVTAVGNKFKENDSQGVDLDFWPAQLLLLQNWITLNQEEGVETRNGTAVGGYLMAHGNVICYNCRDRDASECEEDGIYTPRQVDAQEDPVNFEHNFWCGPFAPEWVNGPVDYDPWISPVLSAASSTAKADGSPVKITATLKSGGFDVADDVPVSFATDLGSFAREKRQDVLHDVLTKEGVATANLSSTVAGYATLSAWAYEDYTEQWHLVTFAPRQPRISFPPKKPAIRQHEPTLRWTASPSTLPTTVYEVKLRRLAPRPRTWLFDIVTDQASYKAPYLESGKYKVFVRACLDDSLTLCSGWAASKFTIK